MYNDFIRLVSKEKEIDEYGDIRTIEVLKDVFAEATSIGTKEFYQAQANGLQPEIKFIIGDYYDYDNQKELIYNGMRYKVLRTYRTENELEITCHGGVNIVST